MIHKRLLSEILYNIINYGFAFNNKIINKPQFKKLKLKPDERPTFKIISNDDVILAMIHILKKIEKYKYIYDI